MKNKSNNTSFGSQPASNKSNFYKKRNHNYQNKSYYQGYKNNPNQNNYYDKSYWRDNYEYQDYEYSEAHSSRVQDPRPYYKKKNFYNNNAYKKQHEIEYDDESMFQYSQHFSERSKASNEIYKEKKNEKEILIIKLLIKGELKRIVLHKNEDISSIVSKFCAENYLDNKICSVLKEKVKDSLKKIDNFSKATINNKSLEILKNIQNLYTIKNEG